MTEIIRGGDGEDKGFEFPNERSCSVSSKEVVVVVRKEATLFVLEKKKPLPLSEKEQRRWGSQGVYLEKKKIKEEREKKLQIKKIKTYIPFFG